MDEVLLRSLDGGLHDQFTWRQVRAPDADVGDERRRRGAEGDPDGLAVAHHGVGGGGVLAVGDVGVQVEEDPARRGSAAVVGWVAVPGRAEGGVRG